METLPTSCGTGHCRAPIRFEPPESKPGRWRTYTEKDGLAGDVVYAIHQSPDGSLWFGTEDGGVSHFEPPRLQGRALANLHPEPGILSGTGGGAARVALVNDELKLERTATYLDGLPTGPVAAMATRTDGAVFLAYNALDTKWFSTPEYAQRRATSRVYFLPAHGHPGNSMELRRGSTPMPQVEVRALALAGDAL